MWYGESNASEYVDTVVKTFIDKGLTREHEGAIIVDVAKEGENIPIEKKKPEIESKIVDANGAKLLIVDDNEMNIKVAMTLLKKYNLEPASCFFCVKNGDK